MSRPRPRAAVLGWNHWDLSRRGADPREPPTYERAAEAFGRYVG